MIDIQAEQVFALSEGPNRLEVERRGGKRIHRATFFRWARNGIRGVRLETIRVGGSLCTSAEALARFFARLSDESPGQGTPARVAPPPRERSRQIARTDRELDALGV